MNALESRLQALLRRVVRGLSRGVELRASWPLLAAAVASASAVAWQVTEGPPHDPTER